MAKTETTVRGYVYTVTSPNGGTVTDAEGKLNKTVDAGDQVTVQAPSDSLTCSDDDAVIYKANFKAPLLALRLLGQGTNSLPAGYTRLSYIQGTGQQYINTNATGNETSEVLCTFERTTTAGKSVYCSGASNNLLCLFVWGDRMDSLRFDWLTSQRTYPDTYPGGMVTTVQSARGVTLNGQPIVGAFPEGAFTAKNIRLFTIDSTSASFTADNVRLARWALTNGGQPVRDMVAVIDPAGIPGMYDRVTQTLFKSARGGNFVAGVGTVAQLTNLLRNLPATGGTLTLSLPAEATTPEVAEALQACHDSKGWTITVHEYRPAPAATSSLRRVRSVVWCSPSPCELGCYVDKFGTRWQIERCAAIFGRLGNDPTAYGYSPYDSVEQAAEVWELQPYVEPEAMGDNGTLEQGGTENTSPETNS